MLSAAIAATLAGGAYTRAATLTFDGTQANKDPDSATHKVNTNTGHQIANNSTTVGLADGMDQWVWNTSASIWAGGAVYATGDNVVFSDNRPDTILRLAGGLAPGSMTFTDGGAGPTNYWLIRGSGGTSADWDYQTAAGVNLTSGSPYVAGQTNSNITLESGFSGVVRIRSRNSNNAIGNTIIRGGILEINDALALPGGNVGTPNNQPPVTLDGGEFRVNVNTNGNSNPAATNLAGTLTVLSNSTLSIAEQWRQAPFVASNNFGATAWNGPVSLPAGVTLTLKSYNGVRLNLQNMNLTGILGTIRLADAGSNVTVVGINNQTNHDALTGLIDLGVGSSEIHSTGASLQFDWGALAGGPNTKLSGSTAAGTTTYSIGARGDNTTFSGTIRDNPTLSTGLAALTKVGTGTLTLAGANTHTGATTVSGGTLALGDAIGAISTSPITVNNAATFRVDNTTNNNDRLGAAAPVTLNQGNMAFVGNLAAGTAEAAGALNVAGGSNVVSTQATGVGAGASISFGTLARTGGVVDFRPSGGVNINLPSASLSNGLIGAYATANGNDWATLDGSNNVVPYAAYTTNTAPATWAATENVNLTAGGLVSVAASATVNSLRLSDASSNVSIAAGQTLNLGSGGLLAAQLPLQTISGPGTLSAGAGATDLIANVVHPNGTVSISAPIADNATGAVKLVKAGAGRLILSGSGSTYTGGTELIGGTLQVGSANFFPAGSNLTINYGTAFDIGGFNQQFGTVALIDGSLLNSGGAAAVSASTAYDVRNGTISAALSGAAALTKTSSAGTVTLTGANTYTGGTVVTNGTLVAGAVGALPAGGAVTVSNGATLNVNANQSVGAVTLGVGTTSGGTIGGTAALTATSFDLQNGTVNAVLAGSAGVSKAAFNTTVTLNGLNTYTGPTTLENITGGTLAINSLANGGQPSAIGASTNAAGNLVLMGTQTLSYTGAGHSTDRLFTVNGNPILANNGTGPISFTNTGAIAHAGGNLTLSGSNTADNIFAPAITAAAGAGQLTKTGGGTWVLTNNANDFSGNIFINGGTLSVATLTNQNIASPIGAGTQISLNGGTLRYTGSTPATTDRSITFGGGNAGGFENNGTGTLTISNTAAIGGTTTGTLRLQGTNTGNNTFAPAVGGTSPVTKSGAGKWRMTGNLTYTGATTVNGGTLEIQGSQTTTGSVTVSGAGAQLTLLSNDSANRFIKTGALAISGGGKIDLQDNKLLTTTAVGAANASGVYSGVQGMVQSAYNFGAWDGPGLSTSEENAGQNAGPLSNTTTIATATAEQVLFIGPTDTAVFQGQTVTGATTIAMYTYAGDLNMDGAVDGADYGVIDNYVQFPGTGGYVNGDFNYDGTIDGADYGVIDNTIQLQGAPFPGVVFGAASASAPGAGGGLAGVTAVPEPSACGFAILGAAALIGRRRRRTQKQD